MNCSFLGRDVKVFCVEMDKLKNNSKPFLVFNIINFILVLFCILFFAIINCNYKYKYKFKNKEDDYNNDNKLIEIINNNESKSMSKDLL